MKKFLSIVCILYSIIIFYVWIEGDIKYFLAPSIEGYIKVTSFFLLILGSILLFDKKYKCKFKISDLVLFLPILMLILSGDKTFSPSFAVNRVNTFSKSSTTNVNKKEEISEVIDNNGVLQDEDEKNIPLDVIETKNTSAYFEIDDTVYDSLSNYLTYDSNSKKFASKTIRVKGFAITSGAFLPNGYIAIGKYSISCCAADAGFTGFMIQNDDKYEIKENKWYEIYGILSLEDDSSYYHVLKIIPLSIKEIDKNSEEYYVYPCYYYDSCDKITKYESGD